jgi:hypothetical protein
MPRLYSLGQGLTLEQPEMPSGGGQEAVAPAPTGKTGDPGRDALGRFLDVVSEVLLGARRHVAVQEPDLGKALGPRRAPPPGPSPVSGVTVLGLVAPSTRSYGPRGPR